eukprot:scaffold174389_cov29-Tisochrysis_lutea.AAC.3
MACSHAMPISVQSRRHRIATESRQGLPSLANRTVKIASSSYGKTPPHIVHRHRVNVFRESLLSTLMREQLFSAIYSTFLKKERSLAS